MNFQLSVCSTYIYKFQQVGGTMIEKNLFGEFT